MCAVPCNTGKAVHLIVQTTIESLAIHEHCAAFKDGHRVRFEHLALPALRTDGLPRVFRVLGLQKGKFHAMTLEAARFKGGLFKFVSSFFSSQMAGNFTGLVQPWIASTLRTRDTAPTHSHALGARAPVNAILLSLDGEIISTLSSQF